MKCPRCGEELRRSKKDPNYGLCDSCRKKYKWVDEYDEDDYEEDEESIERKNCKKNSKKNICSICGSELGVLAGRIMLKDGVLCTSCGGKLPKLPIGQSLYTLDEAKETIRRMKERNQTSKYTGQVPEYVVLQVVLKEAFVGTGSANLSELEVIINRQAAKGYKLHTISTTNGGSKGAGGGDRIQATLVFEKLKY
nr:DUF4177 domain-containing protein [uncultured Schaedlerella sp.]